jgi:hypothetical protein
MLPILADEIEADVDRRMAALRNNVSGVWAGRHEGDEKHDYIFVEFLEDIIGKIATDLQQTLVRMEKRFAREQKRNPKFSKLKPFHDRIIVAGRREVEEKIDIGLLARAMRADRSKDARGGPAFDSPKELERYLRRELA